MIGMCGARLRMRFAIGCVNSGLSMTTTASGGTVEDVIWTYEQPYPAVGDIAGHVAFYPDKAEIVVGS